MSLRCKTSLVVVLVCHNTIQLVLLILFVTVENNSASSLQICHAIFRYHGSQCYASTSLSELKISTVVLRIVVRIHTAFHNLSVRDGVIPKVAHCPGVNATLLSLEFADKFHGANFRSTTDSTCRKDRSTLCQNSLGCPPSRNLPKSIESCLVRPQESRNL